MEFAKKNNFICNHSSEKHFEKDLDLYRATFPDSKILGQLNQANQFNKKSLDERMLLEMLDHVSIEQIQKNRKGSAKPKKKATRKKNTNKRKTSTRKPVQKKS